MFGNQSFLNRIILEHPDNPIKGEINGIPLLRLIEVINDEQWKEFGRLIQHSPHGKIGVDGLGVWKIRNSQLRRYIRTNIKILRKLRKRESFKNEGMTKMIHDDLVLKTRAAWKQLDELRHVWLLRKEVYEAKKAIKAQKEIKV